MYMKFLRFVAGQLFMCHMAVMCMAQQNLVTNPSFEDTIKCPGSSDQVTSSCSNWRSYSTATTPDYFNACNSGNVGVPNNFAGNQAAASGNAYCGVLAYHTLTTHFEYIAGSMTSLVPGNKYEVSMSVNLSNSSSYATDNLGIFLYDSGPSTIGTNTILPTPQVYFDNYGLITDKQNWVRLKKTFVADSAYDNIVIGAFNNSNNTFSKNKINNNGFAAFYYIDSVVVKLTDYFWVTGYDTLLCAGDTVTVDYLLDPVYNTNNVFTLQLSDKNGSFASPLAIGTKNDSTSGSIMGVIPSTVSNGTGYRMRIISSSFADTSDTTTVAIKIGNIDSSNVVITASSSVLCSGLPLNFSASTNVTSTTYAWSGPNNYNSSLASPSFPSTTTAMSGNYYATVSFYGCEVKDTFSVTVNPTPVKPQTGSNMPVCIGDTLKLTATSTAGATYSWTGPNNFSLPFQNPNRYSIVFNDTGDYVVTAKLGNCISVADTIHITANLAPFVVIYPDKDSICDGESVTFITLNNYTGGTPTYEWFVNGVQVSATGSTYTTATLQNNAIVRVNMTEYTKCSNPYVDPSNDLLMRVLQYLAPTVSITANPGGTVLPDQLITFTATSGDAGTNPGYQWRLNGNDVLGAIASKWSSDKLNDNDSVSVQVTSKYYCPQPKIVESNGITIDMVPLGVNGIAKEGQLKIYPNPNNGKFIISGVVTTANGTIAAEVINALGQKIYQQQVVIQNHKLQHEVELGDVATGNYLLRLQDSAGGVVVFKLNLR